MSENHDNAIPKRTRGRPSDPNKLRFVSVGFTPKQREWLRLWRQNPDLTPPDPGTADDNPTQQLQLLLEVAMAFWPEGSAFHLSRQRDERGRFSKR